MGDSEEQKIEEKVKAINLNPSAAATAGQVSPEEDEKADAFKAAGNEAFKGTYDILHVVYFHFQINHWLKLDHFCFFL